MCLLPARVHSAFRDSAGCGVAPSVTWWQQLATGGRLSIPAEKDDPQTLDRFCLTSTFEEESGSFLKLFIC